MPGTVFDPGTTSLATLAAILPVDLCLVDAPEARYSWQLTIPHPPLVASRQSPAHLEAASTPPVRPANPASDPPSFAMEGKRCYMIYRISLAAAAAVGPLHLAWSCRITDPLTGQGRVPPCVWARVCTRVLVTDKNRDCCAGGCWAAELDMLLDCDMEKLLQGPLGCQLLWEDDQAPSGDNTASSEGSVPANGPPPATPGSPAEPGVTAAAAAVLPLARAPPGAPGSPAGPGADSLLPWLGGASLTGSWADCPASPEQSAALVPPGQHLLQHTQARASCQPSGSPIISLPFVHSEQRQRALGTYPPSPASQARRQQLSPQSSAPATGLQPKEQREDGRHGGAEEQRQAALLKRYMQLMLLRHAQLLRQHQVAGPAGPSSGHALKLGPAVEALGASADLMGSSTTKLPLGRPPSGNRMRQPSTAGAVASAPTPGPQPSTRQPSPAPHLKPQQQLLRRLALLPPSAGNKGAAVQLGCKQSWLAPLQDPRPTSVPRSDQPSPVAQPHYGGHVVPALGAPASWPAARKVRNAPDVAACPCMGTAGPSTSQDNHWQQVRHLAHEPPCSALIHT
jgi:hypothetical protein